MRRGSLVLKGIFTMSVALSPGALFAETLPVEGVYGARVDLPPDIEIIATERFAGDWGFGLQTTLTEELGAPVVDDIEFFKVVPAVTASRERIFMVDPSTQNEQSQRLIEVTADRPGVPDAVLRGIATSQVSDYPVSPIKKKECVREEDGKCVEREEVEIPCREVRVAYDTNLLLIDRNGKELYNGADFLTDSEIYCENEYASPDPDAMVNALASQYIDRVRRDLVPQFRQSTPRLLEKRKGLSRDDRRVFKEGLKLTKNDPYGACLAFKSLEDTNPDHVSVLFNIGLCHESEDELELATAYYERALAIEPGKSYPMAGLARIAERYRGEAQLAARGL